MSSYPVIKYCTLPVLLYPRISVLARLRSWLLLGETRTSGGITGLKECISLNSAEKKTKIKNKFACLISGPRKIIFIVIYRLEIKTSRWMIQWSSLSIHPSGQIGFTAFSSPGVILANTVVPSRTSAPQAPSSDHITFAEFSRGEISVQSSRGREIHSGVWNVTQSPFVAYTLRPCLLYQSHCTLQYHPIPPCSFLLRYSIPFDSFTTLSYLKHHHSS